MIKPNNIYLGSSLLFVMAGLVMHDLAEVAAPAGNRAETDPRSSRLESQRSAPITGSSDSPASPASSAFGSTVLQPASEITSAVPTVRDALATGLSVSGSFAPRSRDRDLRKPPSRGQSAAAETGSGLSQASDPLGHLDQSISSDPATADKRPASQPVAMIDIGDPQVSDAPATARIDAIARDFADSLNASGLAPSDPAYRKLWDEQLVKADTRFRSMYGGHAWLRHHIQLHQSIASRSDGN